MLLQGKQAASFARKPDPKVWAVLAFSDDEGLASDNGQLLISAWAGKGVHADVTLLDDDAIRKEPVLLFDALEAVSLLGDPRVVRVRTSGDKIAKLLIEAIEEGDKSTSRFSAHLLIETGSLPKKSKLRATAEAAKHTACLQFFADEGVDIEQRVKQALKESGVDIDPDALRLLWVICPGTGWLPIRKSRNWRCIHADLAGLCLWLRPGPLRNRIRADTLHRHFRHAGRTPGCSQCSLREARHGRYGRYQRAAVPSVRSAPHARCACPD